MRLAAAHRLFEVKDRLRRSPSQASDTLGDQVLHALRDVGLLEERRTIAFCRDQFVELFDLVSELDR